MNVAKRVEGSKQIMGLSATISRDSSFQVVHFFKECVQEIIGQVGPLSSGAML